MERREFLAKTCAAGAASLGGGVVLAEQVPQLNIARLPGESDIAYRTRVAQVRAQQTALMAQRAIARAQDVTARAGGCYYELRRYEIGTEQQQAGFDKFAHEAAIPALNRLGIEKVGVFCPLEGLSPIYLLIPHNSIESFVTLLPRLTEDEEFLVKGSEFINAPADNPAYTNLEISLHRAFEGMPRLETPVQNPERIFQLRIYESPSEKTALKKIEMFNGGEIAVFRKVGLHPVFFGQTLAGAKMPNLTYMLGFQDLEESKANWKKFGADPEWKELRSKPEYADKAILRNQGITNLYLKPASYSQI